jgi:predicted nucleic acid-binding protein
MGVTTSWLVDKSALVRIPRHPDEAVWSQRVEHGLVHVCAVTLLEVGYSSRTGPEHARLLGNGPLSRMIIEWDMSTRVTQRAFEVQGLLAANGQHRGPGVADLLIAATAELAGLTVLHADLDFDLVAAITGQPVQRLADR